MIVPTLAVSVIKPQIFNQVATGKNSLRERGYYDGYLRRIVKDDVYILFNDLFQHRLKVVVQPFKVLDDRNNSPLERWCVRWIVNGSSTEI